MHERAPWPPDNPSTNHSTLPPSLRVQPPQVYPAVGHMAEPVVQKRKSVEMLSVPKAISSKGLTLFIDSQDSRSLYPADGSLAPGSPPNGVAGTSVDPAQLLATAAVIRQTTMDLKKLSNVSRGKTDIEEGEDDEEPIKDVPPEDHDDVVKNFIKSEGLTTEVRCHPRWPHAGSDSVMQGLRTSGEYADRPTLGGEGAPQQVREKRATGEDQAQVAHLLRATLATHAHYDLVSTIDARAGDL